MRAWTMIAGGSLIALSAFAHAFVGWPALRDELQRTGAGTDLVGALGAGWHFGSFAMLAFGLLVVLTGARLRAGRATTLAAPRLVGLAYAAFGTTFCVVRGPSAHFLAFLVLGLLVGLPALGPARREPA